MKTMSMSHLMRTTSRSRQKRTISTVSLNLTYITAYQRPLRSEVRTKPEEEKKRAISRSISHRGIAKVSVNGNFSHTTKTLKPRLDELRGS